MSTPDSRAAVLAILITSSRNNRGTCLPEGQAAQPTMTSTQAMSAPPDTGPDKRSTLHLMLKFRYRPNVAAAARPNLLVPILHQRDQQQLLELTAEALHDRAKLRAR